MGLLSSPLAKLGLGVLSGGALGGTLGIGATAGGIIGGATSQSNSPLASLWKIGGTVNSVGNMLKSSPPALGAVDAGAKVGGDVGAAAATGDLAKGGEAGIGAGAGSAAGASAGTGSAMSRAMDKVSSSPPVLLAQGLQHATNPDVQLPYETRMAAIEPLLRAKHFGYGGGLNG